jgi:hypothetical protein
MARPQAISAELVDSFIKMYMLTGSVETAIKTAGMTRESFYRWQRMVKDGGGTALHKQLFFRLSKAQGEVKARVENLLFTEHFKKNWRPVKWWLSVHHPEEYGKQRQQSDPPRLKTEEELLAIIEAGEPGWQGAMWSLTHRFPEKYGDGKDLSSGAAPQFIVKIVDPNGNATEPAAGQGLAQSSEIPSAGSGAEIWEDPRSGDGVDSVRDDSEEDEG